MKIAFIYPNFERHADSHPELKEFVPANEYLGPPSMGIANVAATTPDGHEIAYFDDRVEAFDCDTEADVYALSFFTPAATRGMELCDELLKRGKTVVAGGIFPSMMPDEVAPHVSSLVIGEGEPVWAQLLEDIEKALAGMYEPVFNVVVDGRAEVRQVFKSSKVGAIAGSFVIEGTIRRGLNVKVLRGGQDIARGRCEGLKRFQDDVREVQTGYECGVVVSGFDKFVEGDVIEFFHEERAN